MGYCLLRFVSPVRLLGIVGTLSCRVFIHVSVANNVHWGTFQGLFQNFLVTSRTSSWTTAALLSTAFTVTKRHFPRILQGQKVSDDVEERLLWMVPSMPNLGRKIFIHKVLHITSPQLGPIRRKHNRVEPNESLFPHITETFPVATCFLHIARISFPLTVPKISFAFWIAIVPTESFRPFSRTAGSRIIPSFLRASYAAAIYVS